MAIKRSIIGFITPNSTHLFKAAEHTENFFSPYIPCQKCLFNYLWPTMTSKWPASLNFGLLFTETQFEYSFQYFSVNDNWMSDSLNETLLYKYIRFKSVRSFKTSLGGYVEINQVSHQFYICLKSISCLREMSKYNVAFPHSAR